MNQNNAFLKGKNKNRSPYVYNRQTLGFRLDTAKEIAAFRYGDVKVLRRIDGFFDYTKALIKTVLNAQEALHLHSDDWQRTVYIDTLGVQATDFNLSDNTKRDLVKSGREHTRAYFEWFEKAKGAEAPVNRV
ncbi:MAG: hypothetical protein OEM59_21880 [Rhodospirillales bacterium]|nr:hypothetical protein [Rhodospirillales bacterium]